MPLEDSWLTDLRYVRYNTTYFVMSSLLFCFSHVTYGGYTPDVPCCLNLEDKVRPTPGCRVGWGRPGLTEVQATSGSLGSPVPLRQVWRCSAERPCYLMYPCTRCATHFEEKSKACEGGTPRVGGHACGFQALSSRVRILLPPKGRAVAPFPVVGCTDESPLVNTIRRADHLKEESRELG